MGLEEQITRAGHYSLIIKEEVDAITQIAENFAIGFVEWFSKNYLKYHDHGMNYTTKELLEIYKKIL